MSSEHVKTILEKVYADSGLGKWFNKESAGGGPGWDRYNTKGERVGKCGDAEEGEAYSACLSRQKAQKLGSEKIGSFVRRKRVAQRKAGRGKKGSIKGKGKKPVFVKTGVTEVKETFDMFIVESLAVVPSLPFSPIEARELLPCDYVINESGEILNVDIVELVHEKYHVTFSDSNGCELYEVFDPETTMGFVDVSEGEETNEYGDKIEIYEEEKKKVKLNKIMKGDVKKYKVYVKNDKGNVVKVNFGDPNMEIKRDDPERRKNFRARHNCDNPGPKWKARYWACRTWSSKSVTSMLKEQSELTEGKNKAKNPKKWSDCIAQAKKKFDVYPCVPLDSLAITKTGPTSYSELKIGDEILSFNTKRDELEWKPILNLHYFENAPLVKVGKSTGFEVKCTPNHKWVVKRGTDYSSTELVETKDLNKHMQIVTCSSLNNTEGLVLENWSKKDSWVEKVLSMSKEQREIFLASAIIYDGHDKGVSTKIFNRHSFGFSQKNEDHFYATVLAAFLNGYHVSFSDKYPDMQAATIIRNKKTHNTQNLMIKETDSEDVWCPETENNTWVMIQNGFITITGNSAYANAWASKCYKGKGGRWKKVSEDIVASTLNSLNEKAYDPDLYGLIKNRTK